MKGRKPKDVKEIYEKSVKQGLLSMPKCRPTFASRLAGEAAPNISDPRTRIRYVEKVAREVQGIKITKVGRHVLVHRDPPGEELDQKCLKRCAEPFIDAFENYIDDEYLETIIRNFCTCKCQKPIDT